MWNQSHLNSYDTLLIFFIGLLYYIYSCDNTKEYMFMTLKTKDVTKKKKVIFSK